MDILFVTCDWQKSKQLLTIVYENETMESLVLKSGRLADAVKFAAEHGGRLVTEAPSESFDLERRAEIPRLAAELGVDVRTIPSSETARERKRRGNKKKTDENDSQMIAHITLRRGFENLKRFSSPPDPSWKHERRLIADEIILERSRGWPNRASLLAYLPKEADAPERVRAVLTTQQRKWCDWVPGFVIAALRCPNRATFLRFVGSYWDGYRGNGGAVLRGTFYFEGVFKRANRPPINARVTDRDYRDKIKPIQRDMTYAVRWLFHQVKKAQAKR